MTIPYKVACFYWFVAKEACLTQENLKKGVFNYVSDVLTIRKQQPSVSVLSCHRLAVTAFPQYSWTQVDPARVYL